MSYQRFKVTKVLRKTCQVCKVAIKLLARIPLGAARARFGNRGYIPDPVHANIKFSLDTAIKVCYNLENFR